MDGKFVCLFLTYTLFGVEGNQTCNTFGNDLVPGSAPSGFQQSLPSFGLVIVNSNAANCAGNATGWNICYYSGSTDVPSTAQFGVYRPASGTTYNLVTGSTTTFAVSQTFSSYTCSFISLAQNQQFTVLQGDILALCVQAPKNYLGSGRLGAVGVVSTGLVVLQTSGFGGCSTLGSSVDTSTLNVQRNYTAHINLVVNSCAYKNGGCEQICTSDSNSSGSTCSCYTGYQLAPNGLNCSDINECSSSNGNCSQTCVNMIGTYSCSCAVGYVLASDNKTCNDLDECTKNNGNCTQTCVNTIGSYSCSCRSGYQLASNNRTCNDVNECSTYNGNCSQVCNNTNGTYFCSCYSGYVLQVNNITCTASVSADSQYTTGSTSFSSSNVLVSQTSALGSISGISISTTSIEMFQPISSAGVFTVNSYSSSAAAISISSTINTFAQQSGAIVPSTTQGGGNSISILPISTSVATIPAQGNKTTFMHTTSVTIAGSTNQGAVPVAGIVIAVVVSGVIVAALVGVAILLKIKRSSKSFILRESRLAAEYQVALSNMIYSSSPDSSSAQTAFLSNSVMYDVVDRVGAPSDLSKPRCGEYETPKRTIYDYTVYNEESATYQNEEQLYYSPASKENDLYMQLKNQSTKNISIKEIEVREKIGSGQFGDVQSGIWKGKEKEIEVAIKTLKTEAKKTEIKIKFLQEAAVMAQFRHPNVIELYGIVTDGPELMIVLELAKGQDLRTHLKSLTPDPGELVSPDVPEQLLKYSQQIALGMQYLSTKQFVHRDLAARNILIALKGREPVCKIADFGMSHDLIDGGYYISKGGAVPVKWTAPEAIHYKKYSTASDVWSYGCLLYEIWSLGHKPFEGITNSETVEKVESGYRLPPPPGCPLVVYQTMIHCWNPDLHARPDFRDLYLSLSQNVEHILLIPHEAHLTHPQAGVLGAILQAGSNMYLNLQKAYIT